jgi:hypothetical protein
MILISSGDNFYDKKTMLTYPMNRDLLIALIYNLPQGPYRPQDCIVIEGHYYGKCFGLTYYVDGHRVRVSQLEALLDLSDLKQIQVPTPDRLGYDLIYKTMTASYPEYPDGDEVCDQEYLVYQRIQNYITSVAYPAYLEWYNEFFRVADQPKAEADLVSLRGGIGNSLDLVIGGLQSSIQTGVQVTRNLVDGSIEKAKGWTGYLKN